MTANPFHSQYQNRCADLVLDLNECFEAVGIWKGKSVCKPIQDDIFECDNFYLRQRAADEIFRIRTKKLLKGEIKSQDCHLPPAPGNSFVYFPNHK